MAVIKHISVKGSNGGDALNYVLYKHNERTGELIVDGRGNPVMRDEYYLDGINCEPYCFAAECKEVNDLYGKNRLPGDIKAHHFIISYDPKDGVEHGLTGSKAQQLSMEWAERCLPGFQILVCTHMDGSNESGNIHTHIMMNSVRKYDTQLDVFGERTIDHLAGYKLNLTKNHLHFMKQELMDICEREGLYQVDLLSPAKDRITDKEYRVHLNGQNRFEEQHVIEGNKHDRTVFQTQKQYMRDAIKDVAYRATAFDDFCSIMQEGYNITVKESRGRISYLHPEREKYITGRALGTDYEIDGVLNMIAGEKNMRINVGERAPKTSYDIPTRIETLEDCKKVFTMRTELKLVIRLQDCAQAQMSAAYVNKVMVSNVKVMAETIVFIQQNGFGSIKDLEQLCADTEKKYDQINMAIEQQRAQIKTINEQIRYTGQYFTNREIYNEMISSKDKRGFRETHQKQISRYEEARHYLKQSYNGKTFLSITDLQDRKEEIQYAMNENMKKRDFVGKDIDVLNIVYKNVKEMILNTRKMETNLKVEKSSFENEL